MRKTKTTDLTVTTLRKRFWELVPKCDGKHRLAARLGEIDYYFQTAEGVYAIQNAKAGKAGEANMLRIINAMEKYVASKQATATKVVERAFKKMKIVPLKQKTI